MSEHSFGNVIDDTNGGPRLDIPVTYLSLETVSIDQFDTGNQDFLLLGKSVSSDNRLRLCRRIDCSFHCLLSYTLYRYFL